MKLRSQKDNVHEDNVAAAVGGDAFDDMTTSTQPPSHQQPGGFRGSSASEAEHPGSTLVPLETTITVSDTPTTARDEDGGDEDAPRSAPIPALSLRMLITLVCAIAVVTVAVFCISISFELSRVALHEVGEEKAHSLLELAMAKTRNYLNEPARHSRAIQRMVRQDSFGESYMLPRDDGPNFARKWLRVMELPMLVSNYSYFHTWLQTADGGLGRTRLFAEDTIASYYFYGPENPTPNEFQVQRVIANQSEANPYVPYPFPTHNGLKFAYWNRSIGFSGKQIGYLFWDNIALTAFPQRQIITIVTPLHNSTDHFLGHASIGINLKSLNSFLRDLGDAHAIVTDGSGYVIGSSVDEDLPTNFTACSDRDSPDCILPAGGQCSKTPPPAPEPGVMCRYHATEFVDSKIRDIARAVPALTDPTAAAQVSLESADGERYFVATAPLELEVMARMDWRVSLITSEDIIMGGVLRSRNYAIVASVVCLVVGTVVIFVLVNKLLKPIGAVADRISSAARLQRGSLDMKRSALKEIVVLQNAFNEMATELNFLRAFVPGAVFADFDGDYSRDGSTALASMGEPSPDQALNPFVADASNSMRSNTESTISKHGNSVSLHSGDGALGEWGDGAVNMKVLHAQRNVFTLRRFSVVRFTCTNLNTKDVAATEIFSREIAAVAVPAVMKAGGIIETLTPCSIIATFNAHCRVVNHESVALSCAIKLEKLLRTVFETSVDDDADNKCASVVWSVLVDTTEGIIGSCGTQEYAVRSSCGEAVDLTEKLHDLVSRYLHTRLAVTDRVVRVVGGHIKRCEFLPIDIVAPSWQQRGRHQSTIIYRPVHHSECPIACLNSFKTAFGKFSKLSDLEECADAFRAIHRTFGLEDALRMMHQCEYIRDHPEVVDGAGPTSQWQKFSRQETGDWAPIGNADVTMTKAPHSSASLEHQSAQGGNNLAPLLQKNVTETESSKAVMRTMQDRQNEFEEVDAGLMNLMMPVNSSGQHSTISAQDHSGYPYAFEDIRGVRWIRSHQCIGSGAIGAVFQGMSQQGLTAALKFLPLESKRVTPQKVVDEVQVFSNMQHDNIVAYTTCATLENHIVVITEYVPLGSLSSVVASFGRISLHAIKRFALDVLAGLAYLHEHNIVHCDIKPQNILLEVDGVCKLADFGEAVSTATSLAQINPDTDEDLDNRDQQPKLAGTAWFMSPEVASGDSPTPASDVWSLGVTLLYVASGQLPFTDDELKLGEMRFIRKMATHATMMPTSAHLNLHPSTPATANTTNHHASPSSGNGVDGKEQRESTSGAGSEAANEQVEMFLDFCRRCCQRTATVRPTVQELQSHAWLL